MSSSPNDYLAKAKSSLHGAALVQEELAKASMKGEVSELFSMQAGLITAAGVAALVDIAESLRFLREKP